MSAKGTLGRNCPGVPFLKLRSRYGSVKLTGQLEKEAFGVFTLSR